MYYSSASRNTERFISRLGLPAERIERGTAVPFILVTPTFADAMGNHAVPKPVVQFLNSHHYLIRGVIGTGNRNFGTTFALGGRTVAAKCGVPLLHRMELAGTETDDQLVTQLYGRMFP